MSEGTNEMVTVTIDGQKISVEKGTTIFEAAHQIGIEIPHYCYDKDLSIAASCRLCLVEIEKVPKLQPSCSTPVADGQIIYTNNEKVLDARRMQMEFLLVQHPLDCPVCDQGGECKLQDYSLNHGSGASRFRFPKRTFPKPDIGPFVDLERNRCILCTRCVRFMKEIAGNAELAVVQRGNSSFISTFMDQPLKNEFAGNTIDLCPVGALTSKITRFRTRVWELKQVPSICSLCSIGCNVYLQYRNRTHEILRVLPRQNNDVNYRWICDIGRFVFDHLNSGERQRMPFQKNESGEIEPSSWAKSIRHTISTLKKTIAEHGSQSIAGLIGLRQTNETLFMFQQFFREVLKSNNIDHRTEQSIEKNDDSYLLSLALNAVNQPFSEIKEASTILLIGTGLPNELPILSLQVREQAVSGKQVIITHSRPTRLDKDVSGVYLYRPGSETAFIAALVHAIWEIIKVDLPKEIHELCEHLDIKQMVQLTGVKEEQYNELAKLLLDSDRVTILTGESVYATQKGSQKVSLIAALARIFQKENNSRLPFSLLPLHNNSRGAADMGCYPHRGPGYEEIEKPGHNTTQILKGCMDGSIKALILFNTDILNEYPDRDLVEKALQSVPFTVVADAYLFETSDYASVFFPLSVYSEEDGTFTNVAGRVQPIRKTLSQLEGSLTGYQVLLALGEQWGAGWRQVRPNQIYANISKAVPHYEELNWEKLGNTGQQPKAIDLSLFKDVETGIPSKIEFAEQPPEEYPFRLVWGANLFDIRGEKRFSPAMLERSESCIAEINPHDAEKLGLKEGNNVTIIGEKGSLELPFVASLANFGGCVTILGRYPGMSINNLVAEESPWVRIQP